MPKAQLKPCDSPDVATKSNERMNHLHYSMQNGVVQYEGQPQFPISYAIYLRHQDTLQRVIYDGPCRSACRNRLKILEKCYDMYKILNAELEEKICCNGDATDIYGAPKVDSHVPISTLMSAAQLIQFMKRKATEDGSKIVEVTKIRVDV